MGLSENLLKGGGCGRRNGNSKRSGKRGRKRGLH